MKLEKTSHMSRSSFSSTEHSLYIKFNSKKGQQVNHLLMFCGLTEEGAINLPTIPAHKRRSTLGLCRCASYIFSAETESAH